MPIRGILADQILDRTIVDIETEVAWSCERKPCLATKGLRSTHANDGHFVALLERAVVDPVTIPIEDRE